MLLDNHLWNHFPLTDGKPSETKPIRHFFRHVCPLCGGKLIKRKIGPIVESRHSIYLFKFWLCKCYYLYAEYYLDLGGI